MSKSVQKRLDACDTSEAEKNKRARAQLDAAHTLSKAYRLADELRNHLAISPPDAAAQIEQYSIREGQLMREVAEWKELHAERIRDIDRGREQIAKLEAALHGMLNEVMIHGREHWPEVVAARTALREALGEKP